jgi:hypothetical protein
MVPGNNQIVDDIFADIRKALDEMSLPEAARFGKILSVGIKDRRSGGFVMTLLEIPMADKRSEIYAKLISV